MQALNQSMQSAFQRKAAAQRVFSACRLRSDETALWHTLTRPPVSGPQGGGEQRTGYCKSKQSSRWGAKAGCQPGSTEIPSHCYTQPMKITVPKDKRSHLQTRTQKWFVDDFRNKLLFKMAWIVFIFNLQQLFFVHPDTVLPSIDVDQHDFICVCGLQ